MNTNDAAFIYRFTMTDEQASALLQVEQGIAQCLACAVADQYTVDALPYVLGFIGHSVNTL
jgi:hypothetical protein